MILMRWHRWNGEVITVNANGDRWGRSVHIERASLGRDTDLRGVYSANGFIGSDGRSGPGLIYVNHATLTFPTHKEVSP
jgi:hypothetical protein